MYFYRCIIDSPEKEANVIFDIDQIKQALENLKSVDFLKDIETEVSKSYDVKNHWFDNDKKISTIPYAERNGIYIYTKRDEEILYIGKGEYDSGGGIGFQSCSHLGAATRNSEVMFENHQWKNETPDKDKEEMEEIKRIIATGDFLIWTIPVKPEHFTSLIEVYLQTFCIYISGELPKLNKRIG